MTLRHYVAGALLAIILVTMAVLMYTAEPRAPEPPPAESTK